MALPQKRPFALDGISPFERGDGAGGPSSCDGGLPQGRTENKLAFRRAEDLLDQLKMPFWHPGLGARVLSLVQMLVKVRRSVADALGGRNVCMSEFE